MEEIATVECIGRFENEYVYDLEVADSHTFLANDIIVHNTDSLFVHLGDGSIQEKVKTAEEVQFKLNSLLKAKVEAKTQIESKIELEFEKLYKSVLFIGLKKKYAGLLVYKDGKFLDTPKFAVTGFEIVRKDTPEAAKLLLKEAFVKILEFEDFHSFEKWIHSRIVDINLTFDDQYCVCLEITKPFDLYASFPIHARAAKYSQDYLGIDFVPGDKVNMMYVKATPPGIPHTDVVAYKDDSTKLNGFTIDREKWVEKSIENKLKPLLKALDCEWLTFDPNQSRLSAWN